MGSGIHAEIAGNLSEQWHKLAPLPWEMVKAAGQKAKEDPRWSEAGIGGEAGEERERGVDVNADSTIESLFAVERGLRNLSALKVEEAVMQALAHHRRQALVRGMAAASPTAVPSSAASGAELSAEEVEDVQFKQVRAAPPSHLEMQVINRREAEGLGLGFRTGWCTSGGEL